jgi:hypothetical protein
MRYRPGSYLTWLQCREGYAKESVFVELNSVTRKVLLSVCLLRSMGGVIKDEDGKPLVHRLVVVSNAEPKHHT